MNHAERIRTPLIRYRKGGKLIPATWDEAIRHVAQKLDATADAHGPNAIGVVGSPRITNESNYVLYKFASELVGTENYTATEAFSLKSLFDNLGGPLATHNDIRHATSILLIGGEPEELQPLTAKQVRQAVRNGGAKLTVINSVPIRLTEQASRFIHIRPGSLDAAVLALQETSQDELIAGKLGIDQRELTTLRQSLTESQGDMVIMFSAELGAEAQAVVAQLPYALGGEGRRVLLHPLPLFNNSVGAHDMRIMDGALSTIQMLDAAGENIRALYMAGSFLKEQLRGREGALGKLEFLVVQELFETETTALADVVLPAASFAEVDGTFTNNDGFVQRVRQSIPPVHSSKPDWVITAQIANELGVDFGFQMSASAVFREIAERVPAYLELRYPVLKDEAHPVQVRHAIAERRDLSATVHTLTALVEALPETAEKILLTPKVGHELFKVGALTGKTPQFHLLAAGNPRPETVSISPLYQITIDDSLRAEALASGD
ncbi:MAG: molybdopterin-dependent oxidoreductase [Pyrinomonadaceae bacterium]|nr:molybdopterin-dependent oxidoreductase [Pyrinomonadaceae bacterium]